MTSPIGIPQTRRRPRSQREGSLQRGQTANPFPQQACPSRPSRGHDRDTAGFPAGGTHRIGPRPPAQTSRLRPSSSPLKRGEVPQPASYTQASPCNAAYEHAPAGRRTRFRPWHTCFFREQSEQYITKHNGTARGEKKKKRKQLAEGSEATEKREGTKTGRGDTRDPRIAWRTLPLPLLRGPP